MEKTKELLKSQIVLDVHKMKEQNPGSFRENVIKIIESVLAPKMSNYYQFLANLTYEACHVITEDGGKSFNEDSLRICKILGASLEDSMVIKGFVINRGLESSGKEYLENAKVVVYRCPFQLESGETKTSVLIQNSQDLINFSNSEEVFAENLVKSIVEVGANTVVVGGSISDICLHYMNKYGLLVLKVPSKFELVRIARLLNAKTLPTVSAPMVDDLGYCDVVKVEEIGSTQVTVFQKNQENAHLCTIILRGATQALMENTQRALENAVSAYKQVLHDGRYLHGASSLECYLVNQLEQHSKTLKGLEQYGCLKFGQAFESFGKILLDNSGLNSNLYLAELVNKNSEGC